MTLASQLPLANALQHPSLKGASLPRAYDLDVCHMRAAEFIPDVGKQRLLVLAQPLWVVAGVQFDFPRRIELAGLPLVHPNVAHGPATVEVVDQSGDRLLDILTAGAVQ